MDNLIGDPRDLALLAALPTMAVPKFGKFHEFDRIGDRLLVASNGVWLEINRGWLYARHKVGDLSCTVPYGESSEILRWKFGRLPRQLVLEFIQHARNRMPHECAAWVIWNELTAEFRLMMLEEISSGRAHVKVHLPRLEEHEHLVLDLHSHAALPAYFSEGDNADDKHECKLAGVIGSLDQEQVTAEFRMCLNGFFLPVPFNLQEKE